MNRSRSFVAVALAVLMVMAGCAERPVLENVASPSQLENAQTAAEHEALAKIFETEAASLTKKAALHRQMARTPVKSAQAEIAQHCAALEKAYAAAAQQNLELAAVQRRMAKEAAR